MLHPKTEHSHGYGLELENETDHKDYTLHAYTGDHGYGGGENGYSGGSDDHYDGSQQHNTYETVEHQSDYDGGSLGSASETKELSHHQFQDITVHHGHGQ